MKAIIEFDLPSEEHQHKYAINGRKLYEIIAEMDNYLYEQINNAKNSDLLSDGQLEAYANTNDVFNNIIRKKLNVKYIKEW